MRTHERIALLPRTPRGTFAVAATLLAAGCGGSSQQSVESSSDPITETSGTVDKGASITDNAYVASAYPSDTHGSEDYLITGTASSNEHHSYIKISVSSIPSGATGVTAKLTVTPEETAAVTVNAHCASSTSWSGATLTWNNQPGFDASVVSHVSSVTEGAAASFDVSACVTGNGTFTVVLDEPTGAVVKYGSIAAGATGPAIAVSYTPPPVTSVIFGMFNNTAVPPGSEVNSSANYRTIADKWLDGSKMKIHRVYNAAGDFPSTYAKSAGADDPANGNVSFLSVKSPGGDHAGVAAGKYDAEIASLAASIPAGCYFTMWHEPENDMPAADFVAMFKHFYAVAKKANPKLGIGYVAMSFQWRPGSSTTADEDAWYPGADSTDFLGVDTYVEGWSGAHSLDTASDFQRWYSWALPKGKPILLPEYGVESSLSSKGFSDAERATIIDGSMAYLATQPMIKMVLYWNGTSSTPGGIDHFLNPTTSFPTDDFAMARAAWNAGVALYGSSGTTY